MLARPDSDLSLPDAWQEALERIQQRINQQSYHTWFHPISCRSEGGDKVVLAVPSKFHQDWVCDHYLGFIGEQLQAICGRSIAIELMVEPGLAKPIAIELPERIAPPVPQPSGVEMAAGHRLNERYTFESFVAGPSNQFAHAACKAVAESPASAYNPLFIYGGVGLGKTHLSHAIGNAIVARDPRTRVIYVSTEEFMNDLIDSLRHEKMNQFRARYRSRCDVLLVDDIQFLSGKDRTQEEFFHTFNHLYESQRQIVITSDKFPHEIAGIEERLRTRFQCGLIADIQPPEMETRVAIIMTKAETDRIELPDDVALFLATNITSNVRELEGSLIRLQAYASLSNQPITLELARERLKGLISTADKAISVEQIQKLVANYYSLKVSELRGNRRHRAVSLPRQVAMFLSRKHSGLSFPEIGERFSKDHSTVISAVRKIEGALLTDDGLKRAIETIEHSLAA